VAIQLLIGSGTTLDPAGKAGLAELSAGLLLESVPDWLGDPADVGKIVAAGKSFRCTVDWDSTHLYAECAPEELEIYLQALSRFVRNPIMSEKHFPPVQEKMLKRLQSIPATAFSIAETVFDIELFRGNPYGRMITGVPDTIRNIRYGDAVLFQRRYHLPNVSTLTVVGNAEANLVKTLAGRYLGIWIMDDPSPFTFMPPHGPSGLSMAAADWAPAAAAPALIVGQLGVTRDSKDFDLLQLLASILAARSVNALEMSPSPAGKASAGSEGEWKGTMTADGRRLRGALRMHFQSKDMKVDFILRQVRRTLAALRDTGPTADEVSQAVRSFLSNMNNEAQKAPALARMLAEAETYQLGFNYYERLKQELPLLAPDDIKRAAQRLFDLGNLLAVFVGSTAALNMDSLKADGWQVQVVPLK
jgi:zinc protease